MPSPPSRPRNAAATQEAILISAIRNFARAGYDGVGVREIAGDALVFDFNHPLAGRPVTFDVQLIGILEA